MLHLLRQLRCLVLKNVNIRQQVATKCAGEFEKFCNCLILLVLDVL